MLQYKLADSADVTTFTVTEPLKLGDLKGFAIQVDFSSATINGDLKLQAQARDTLSWIDVLDSDQAIASGASHMWNVREAEYFAVRVSWSYTSGAGTLTINSYIKETPVIGV